MARDYKAKRKSGRGAGWMGVAAGLAIGLAVALAVYVRDHRTGLDVHADRTEHADRRRTRTAESPGADGAAAPTGGGTGAAGGGASAAGAAPGAGGAATAAASKSYAFYDMLPKFEVVVPEKEKDVRPDVKAVPETRRGTYVLQAGSYRTFADADRVRAKLALKGIESKVQKVSVDNDTWLRVRIGPISNLDELNRLRQVLRKADVDVLVIRVGD